MDGSSGRPMTWRIETTLEGRRATLRLIGRIRSENLDDLKNQITACGPAPALDLDQLMLVDVEVVRFLKIAEREGIELRNCPAYIREWMIREREGEE
jgi:hypothetical protein